MAKVVIEMEDVFGEDQFKIKCTPEVSTLTSIHKSGNTLTSAQSAALRFIASAIEESHVNNPQRSSIWTPVKKGIS